MNKLKLKRLSCGIVLGAFAASGAHAVPVPGGTLDSAGHESVTLWSDPITTVPALGATELWNMTNISADAHPDKLF